MIYISSDEDEAMDSNSFSSFYDFLSSSEDESEEVSMMALHVEAQMSEPIAIPEALPSTSRKLNEPGRPNMPLFQFSTRRTLVSEKAMGH